MPDSLLERHTGLPATLGLPPMRRELLRGSVRPQRGEITALIDLSFEDDDDEATCVMAPQELPDFARRAPTSPARSLLAALSERTRQRAVAGLQIAFGAVAVIVCVAGIVGALNSPTEPVRTLAKGVRRLSLDHLSADLRASGASAKPARAEVDIPVISLDDLPELGSKPKRARTTVWAWKRHFRHSISQRPLPETYKAPQRAKRTGR
jgi:hypothetical protein